MPAGDAALVYGATSLMMTGAEGLGYRIEATADGTNWGNPVAVVTAVQSRLQDGSLAIVDSYENREASIFVRITASSFNGLAAGEAALVAETRKAGYNTLSWTPSASMVVPSVFDVVYGSLAFSFDDLRESQAMQRMFTLTLNCLPFPRSVTAIVAAALAPPPATPTTVSVDDGTLTTNWTGSPSAATSSGGAVRESPSIAFVDDGSSTSGWSASKSQPASTATISTSGASVVANVYNSSSAVFSSASVGAVRTGSVSLVGTPYIAIDDVIAPDRGYTMSGFGVYVDGASVSVLSNQALGNGYYRLWVKPSGSSFSTIEVRAEFTNNGVTNGPGGLIGGVAIDQIFRSNIGPGSTALSLTRAGSIPTSATPYITVDYTSANVGTALFSLNDTSVTPVSSANIGGGVTRVWLRSLAATVTSVGVGTQIPDATVFAGDFTTSQIAVDRIDRTDTVPGSGTRRQLTRTLPVAGSARTQGQLSLQHESTALGEALVYVYRDTAASTYAPPLRPYRNAGGTVTGDTSLYSGASDNLNTLVQFDIPASSLPAGNYRLMARLQRASTSTPTLTITANTRVGGINLPGGVTMNSAVTVNPTYAILDLGPLTLPTTALASASAGTVRITIEDVADTNVILDDAYLVNVDIGTVTIVDCGTGTPAAGGPSKRLWLDPATVTNNGKDSVLRGHTADRSDAFNPADSIRGWTPPQFEPPTMKVFTACNALDAAVELRHYPRFLHNAYAVA